VGVIGETIVGAANGEDRTEILDPPRAATWRAPNPPPGLSHHADRARAPGLRSEPTDRFASVVDLLWEVLVEQHSVGISRAAQVDPHRGVAVTGEVPVHRLVPIPHAIPLAVGMYSKTAGTGDDSASSGSQILAATRPPSGRGMKTFPMSRTRRGKELTTLMPR
jgi:hypothetical protein